MPTIDQIIGVLEFLESGAEVAWREDDPFGRGYLQALADVQLLVCKGLPKGPDDAPTLFAELVIHPPKGVQ